MSILSFPRRPATFLLGTVPLLVCGTTACNRAGAADSDTIDALPLLQAEEELRIGDVDDPTVGFSQIFLMDVDAEGNLYVVERSVPEIRVYSPDGRLLRRFGGSGGGPGEFQEIAGFGVQGEVVWAFDWRQRRLTFFDRQGVLTSTASLEDVFVPLTSGQGYLFPHRMLEDGTLTSRLSALQYGNGDPGLVDSPTDLIPVPVVRFGQSGEAMDTIGWVERPMPGLWRPAAEEPGETETVVVGGLGRTVPQPRPDWVELAQLHDSYIVVERPSPANEADGHVVATRVSFGGDTLYRRELRYIPPRYTDSDLDYIAARAVSGSGSGFSAASGSEPPVENPEAVTNRIRAAMKYPEFQLPIESATVTEDGSLWIAYHPVRSDTTTWIILRPDGTPRGRVALPSRAKILYHSGDSLYAAVPDELDVPWLVRYRLSNP